MNRWISVKEGLPEEDGFYLVVCDGEVEYANHFNNLWLVDGLGDCTNDVTYWMEIPKPPED